MPVATVTHTEPFHVSKSIATLDYVSGGRAGWQARVSGTAHEAALFGRRDVQGVVGVPPARGGPFDEAGDFVEVVRRLWDSWEDDAVIRDVATGRYVDRDKLHYIDFVGKYFSVKGPSITPRPPQGQPVIAALAHGPRIYEFASASADIVFVTPQDDESLLRILDEVEQAGGKVKVYADVLVSLAADPLTPVDAVGSDAYVFAGGTTGLAGSSAALERSRCRRVPAAAGRQRAGPAHDRRRAGNAPAARRGVPHRVPRRRNAAGAAGSTQGDQPVRGAAMTGVPLSILDLSPISQGCDVATALRNTIDLAQHAERWGFKRFWVAEHHFVAVASSQPALLIGQIADATNNIRVGAAAVQLGHTTPLAVVESFGMLDAFHPAASIWASGGRASAAGRRHETARNLAAAAGAGVARGGRGGRFRRRST